MTVLTCVYDLGGRGLLRLFNVLFASGNSRDAIPAGPRRATGTSGMVERSLNWVLSILNLPSKADYNRLLSKVEVLQGSLMNLNIKVDRLLAARDRPRREPPDGEGGVEEGSGKRQ